MPSLNAVNYIPVSLLRIVYRKQVYILELQSLRLTSSPFSTFRGGCEHCVAHSIVEICAMCLFAVPFRRWFETTQSSFLERIVSKTLLHQCPRARRRVYSPICYLKRTRDRLSPLRFVSNSNLLVATQHPGFFSPRTSTRSSALVCLKLEEESAVIGCGPVAYEVRVRCFQGAANSDPHFIGIAGKWCVGGNRRFSQKFFQKSRTQEDCFENGHAVCKHAKLLNSWPTTSEKPRLFRFAYFFRNVGLETADKCMILLF